MEQVIKYHSDMATLEKQGVPIDWKQVAQVMANTLMAAPPPAVVESEAA